MQYSASQRVRKQYSKDKSMYCITPALVAFPRTEADLIELVRFARRSKQPVTPRGGGTGLAGAALGSGIVVDFTKHFTTIKAVGKTITVESGVLLKDLRTAVEKKGYMLPSVPLHGDCAIGGNINTRSIGTLSVKYGAINQQVVSLRGVLADGKILDTAKSIPEDIRQNLYALKLELTKNKALVSFLKKRPPSAGGYHLNALLKHHDMQSILNNLIVGSTGTLMLLTEVRLKLPQRKKMKSFYVIYAKNYGQLQHILNKVLKCNPAFLEYADAVTLRVWPEKFRHKDAVGLLAAGFEEYKSIAAVTKNALAWKKLDQEETIVFLGSRAQSLPQLKAKAKKMHMQLPSVLDDVSFHPRDFAKIMQAINSYQARNAITMAAYGHLGVGSIHLRPFLAMQKDLLKLDSIAKDIFKILQQYNGTLIGEHNAGRSHSRYLAMESKVMYTYMKKIKKIFDPQNILNPKVLFDLDPMLKNVSY